MKMQSKWKSMAILLLSIFLWQLAWIDRASASISVHEGTLDTVTCSSAILSMNGDSSHKSNWWQFLQYLKSSNEDAFIGYLLSNFTGQIPLQDEMSELGRLSGTRNSSLIEIQSTRNIKSLGTMELTMWAVGFVCLDNAASCTKFTPVVLQEIPGATNESYGFFSLWEEEDDGDLTNSVGSKVLSLENWNLAAENTTGLTLRTITSGGRLPLCKGLALNRSQADDSTQHLTGDLPQDFQFQIKTAPEAAGFELNHPVTSITRPPRSLCLLGIDDSSSSSSTNSSSSNSSDSSPGRHLQTTTTLVYILASFMLQVMGSYIQSQNSALDLEHPGTDFLMAVVALPSAFIAVVAAAIPFINFQLRLFKDLTTSQKWKVAVLCLSNSALAVASYSAVIAVTPAEIRRQKLFRTWGLLADQVPISSRGLQVLVVVRGESAYTSYSLILAWCSTGMLVPLVAWMTLVRCRQVFYRRRLLKRLNEGPGSERLDDLRAIEMTSVKERQLEMRLDTLQAWDKTGKGQADFWGSLIRRSGKIYPRVSSSVV